MTRVLFLFIFICNSLFAIDATMEIVKKSTNLPLLLVNIATDCTNVKYAKKIKKTISQDLAVSGHFDIIDKDVRSFYNEKADIVKLRENNIDLFLNINVEESSFGSLILYIKLYDINSDSLVLNKTFSTSKKQRHPFLSHRASIAVNNYLNAPPIDWMDKFVIFSRYKNAKQSEIVISDYTLTFQKVVIKGGLNIFPKWADKSQESFYYTTYNNILPTLMRANLYSGKQEKILSSDGMIVCSDVNSDGSKILLTMAPNSQPDIYLYDLNKKVKTRLTRYKGIDVGGSFVENDKKVVFVSDRLKYPNIFAKKIGARGIERLVYHGRNNSSCTTYKSYIVYTSREGDNEFSKDSFNLYLISTKSDFIRRLTTTGKNQFPKFSSDGESILFTKTYEGKSSLGIIRINYNKSFLFPLKIGRLQSIDW